MNCLKYLLFFSHACDGIEAYVNTNEDTEIDSSTEEEDHVDKLYMFASLLKCFLIWFKGICYFIDCLTIFVIFTYLH